jgi:bifunctional DNA-binding transcriptional regulator/antitoxin component of YhaV-PrlF toxin-antitoxin module
MLPLLTREVTMGYLTKIQVIQRAKSTRQFYIICPAPLAEAMELQKGEEAEWIVQDKKNLILRRVGLEKKSKAGKSKDAK